MHSAVSHKNKSWLLPVLPLIPKKKKRVKKVRNFSTNKPVNSLGRIKNNLKTWLNSFLHLKVTILTYKFSSHCLFKIWQYQKEKVHFIERFFPEEIFQKLSRSLCTNPTLANKMWLPFALSTDRDKDWYDSIKEN